MIRSTIRAKARRKLDEETATFWEDDDLNDFLDEAIRYYWLWMVEADHPATKTETTHNIVAGTSTIALPSDWIASRLIERVFDTFTYPVWWYERFEAPNYTAGASTTSVVGYLPRVRFSGTNLLLEPTPADNITGGIRHEYYYVPSDIADDSASPPSPLGNLYPEMLIHRMVLLAKQKEEMIGGGGVDVSTTERILMPYEQKFKETIEVPAKHRSYVQPFMC